MPYAIVLSFLLAPAGPTWASGDCACGEHYNRTNDPDWCKRDMCPGGNHGDKYKDWPGCAGTGGSSGATGSSGALGTYQDLRQSGFNRTEAAAGAVTMQSVEQFSNEFGKWFFGDPQAKQKQEAEKRAQAEQAELARLEAECAKEERASKFAEDKTELAGQLRDLSAPPAKRGSTAFAQDQELARRCGIPRPLCPKRSEAADFRQAIADYRDRRRQWEQRCVAKTGDAGLSLRGTPGAQGSGELRIRDLSATPVASKPKPHPIDDAELRRLCRLIKSNNAKIAAALQRPRREK